MAAGGYDPRPSVFHALRQDWASGDELVVEFDMPVQVRRAHPKVRGHQGMAAVTRGPLVYCLESVDNPGMDLFSARLDPETLFPVFEEEQLEGMVKIQGKTVGGEPLTFIPYYLWGNRGPSQMTVWVNVKP